MKGSKKKTPSPTSGDAPAKSASANASTTPTTASAPKEPATPPSTQRKFMGVVPIPNVLVQAAVWLASLSVVVLACKEAYRIRTYALVDYGYVIHEFDPWFNFRATQYLSKHGWDAFFSWFDYMSWYPLGRPVGSTIYPGMQITAVAIHRALRWAGKFDKKFRMSLNDVCCTFPCWFGAVATLFIGLMTLEATNSRSAAVVACLVMAILPAHIMRSVGGGYDNESLAMSAMTMTFYFWMRSLRTEASWPIGILAGLAYGYMVAAWGGYIFVLNLIALHAASCVIVDFLRNRFSIGLYKAYTSFFIVGTAIAVRVPPVGWAPFKSVEQLAALLTFLVLQALYLAHRERTAKKLTHVIGVKSIGIMIRNVAVLAGILAFVATFCVPDGFFGPLSSRVRGLFVQHTRTGNPLVDSVAEHQPASANAYWHYLHYCYYTWGVAVAVLPFINNGRLYSRLFFIVYGTVIYYLANRMARLVLLTAPMGAASAGICIGLVAGYGFNLFYWSEAENKIEEPVAPSKNTPASERGPLGLQGDKAYYYGALAYSKILKSIVKLRYVLQVLFIVLVAYVVPQEHWKPFREHCEQVAKQSSHPQLMFIQYHQGQKYIIDDYRQAYHWLRDKTPQDSRVMAWWDYGYQITGIGNRTSIADGNTWNHEHIATLGKCLTSPVKEAHTLVRHLADYVLVWAGGRGDDLMKSPHMARIGNSVYRDICPNDPMCRQFGFMSSDFSKPTPMMNASLLYNLHSHNMRGGVSIDNKLFKHVYDSKHRLVRIFKVENVSQESKDWVADPANRKCDPPGSWQCAGQYPPAEPIQKLLKKRVDFAQLEDFNRKGRDEKYVKEYMKKASEGH